MIRRPVLVAAAAVALALVPSAAMAYDAPGYGTTVSDATPAVGSAFSLTVTGVDPGAVVTLKVAGKSYTATANANGAATFTVTLTAVGTYTARAYVNGALVSDEVVTVVSGASAGAELSSTGFESAGLAAGAGVLVLAGAGAVLVAKRRRSPSAFD